MADTAPSPPAKGATVARAGGIMMASLLLSRILGLLRDTFMAKQFGIGFDTDAYRIAVTIPDTIFFLIAGGGLSSAFIPIFSEFIHTDREKDAWKVFSVVTTACAMLVTVLIAIAWIFAPQIAAFMAAGKLHADGTPLTGAEMQQIVLMSRIMLPAQFAFLVGSVLLATLYARNRFVAPGVAPNIYNVGIIAGAFVGPWIGIGIAGMSWGALIGAVIGNLLVPVIVIARLGGHFRPSLDLHAPGVRKFFRLLLPVILGFSLPSVAALITQKFSSAYELGTNTVMQLSNNLMQAPLGIFGQSLALAAFPALTAFFATGQMDKYRFQTTQTLKTVLYLALPSAAILYALAPEMVHLVYGYGKAASTTDLDRVVVALRIFTVGIPAWCMQPVLMRGFFSLHKTLKPVVIGTVMTALFILMCWLGSRSGFGYTALSWATNIAAILLAIALYIGLEQEVGSLGVGGLLLTLFKGALGAAAMGAFAYSSTLVFAPQSRVAMFAVFILRVVFAGWIYYFTTRALKMPETDYFNRALKRLDRNKRPISEEEAGGL